MINYLVSKPVKMAMSATIAVFIATKLGLEFGVTAGIIAILSILNTKKEAISVGIRRLIAATIAILLSFVLYLFLGNSPLIFGIFLLIFIPVTLKLKIDEGMVVGAVLSTHLLSSNNIDIFWIGNELALALIGILVALVFNLYSPSLEEKFERNREKIEEKYRIILSDMAVSLVTHAVPIHEQKLLNEVEDILGETREIAHRIIGNYLFKNDSYFVDYIDMRIMQMDTIKRMMKHFYRFNMTYDQTLILSEFTRNVACNIREDNDCVKLIKKLNILRDDYKKMELPKSREEFENRALLFQFLNDLEDFLLIKNEYKRNILIINK